MVLGLPDVSIKKRKIFIDTSLYWFYPTTVIFHIPLNYIESDRDVSLKELLIKTDIY